MKGISLKTLLLVFFIALVTTFVVPTNQKVYAMDFLDINDIDANLDGPGDNSEYHFDENMNFITTKNVDEEDFWNTLYRNYKGVIIFVSGAIALVFVGLFMINGMRYMGSANNPQARKAAITIMLWTGIGAAIFGAVTLFVGFGYNLFLEDIY